MTCLILNCYNSSNALVGKGPIYNIVDAEVREALDEVGDISFTLPAGDERIGDTIDDSTCTYVELLYAPPNGSPTVIGRGLTRAGTKRLEIREGRYLQRYNLPSLLRELAWAATCQQHDYDTTPDCWLNQVISDDEIAAPMYGLLHESWGAPAGWEGNVVDGNVGGTWEFNGESVLEGIGNILADLSYHYRESLSTRRQIDYGALGADSGVRITQAPVATRDLANQAAILYLTSLEVEEERDELVNWLTPLGANRSSTGFRLDLSSATLLAPYRATTMSDPNGNTRYYLKDSTSSAAYGERRQVYFRNDIEAKSDSTTDVVEAANKLHSAACQYIVQHKDPNITYSCSVIDPSGSNVGAAIQMGETVHLSYRGVATQRGTAYQFVDINTDIMVVERTRRFDAGGLSGYDLKLSTMERRPRGNADVVRGIYKQVRAAIMHPQGT